MKGGALAMRSGRGEAIHRDPAHYNRRMRLVNSTKSCTRISRITRMGGVLLMVGAVFGCTAAPVAPGATQTLGVSEVSSVLSSSQIPRVSTATQTLGLLETPS